MIKHLRTKFIRIAMLSVALVLLALSLIVNAANFISTNRDLNQTLDMIYENQGTIPAALPEQTVRHQKIRRRTIRRLTRRRNPGSRRRTRRRKTTPRRRRQITRRRSSKRSRTRSHRASRGARGGRLTPKRRTPRVIFTYALTRTEISTAAIFRTLPP